MSNQNAAIQNLRSKVARQNGLLREARSYIERLQATREKNRCPDRLHFGGEKGSGRQQQPMRTETRHQQERISGSTRHVNLFDHNNTEVARHHHYQQQKQRQQNWTNQCLPSPQRHPVLQPSAVYSRASSTSHHANPLRSPLLSTTRRSLYSPLFLPPQPAHFR
ncbi:hypothetical protein COEREDRAFT_11753 [Coemansia reversa NRRL 1564]|uniref:Uncharacterized protein n=1 Tax=Coemansia reversa (strain ATCC 12441 / NRRL 1564) TaxID=763665 RepID=A0A2G5B2E5_COERN|nr:hypothetical protein COEREDRAFT_11753 [Coemansia reversa NRRL 1564]|eukprot:PIA13161.1 hypothetical protein COEREDRAFT_11753 [Coemansia reversa NRRL 1564]